MPRRLRVLLVAAALGLLAPAGQALAAPEPADAILVNRNLSLWLVDPADGAATRLTRGTQESLSDWSPDRTLIAYGTDRVATQEVWLAGADGGGARRLTFSSPGQAHDPSFAPAGDRLVYVRSPKGVFAGQRAPRNPVTGLFVARLDGARPTRLTAGATDQLPDWGANGLVAFVRFTARGAELFAVREGGRPRRLLPTPTDRRWGGDSEPSWSPDGTRIAFARARVGRGEGEVVSSIYVARADGTGLRRLTRSGDATSPTWSPDGTRIAFVRNGRLSVMDADGSGVRSFPAVPGGDLWPAWS
ncbi:MAG: hypothetical protein R3C15_21885 [Thermoleophilia bacterium]